jgi:hypothetical protein
VFEPKGVIEYPEKGVQVIKPVDESKPRKNSRKKSDHSNEGNKNTPKKNIKNKQSYTEIEHPTDKH